MLLFLFEGVFSGKVDSAFFVRAEELDRYLIADGNNIFNIFNSLCIELGDMNKTFFSGRDFNNCADRNDSCDRAGVAAAFNGLEYDSVDYALRNVSILFVYGENED